MKELDIGAAKYRTGKLDVFRQFHLTRKLLPLMSGVASTYASGGSLNIGDPGFWRALGPVAQAIADMSTEDSEWVLKTCLSACSMFNGRNWVPVMTTDGYLMFENIDMPTMLQLCSSVLEDNLGSFFTAPQPNGSDGEALASPSPLSA